MKCPDCGTITDFPEAHECKVGFYQLAYGGNKTSMIYRGGSTHTQHPNSHDNGLADGCPRCQEHADHLDSLDTANLRNIHIRILYGRPARSETEQLAMDNLDHILLIARRLGLRQAFMDAYGFKRE